MAGEEVGWGLFFLTLCCKLLIAVIHWIKCKSNYVLCVSLSLCHSTLLHANRRQSREKKHYQTHTQRSPLWPSVKWVNIVYMCVCVCIWQCVVMSAWQCILHLCLTCERARQRAGRKVSWLTTQHRDISLWSVCCLCTCYPQDSPLDTKGTPFCSISQIITHLGIKMS